MIRSASRVSECCGYVVDAATHVASEGLTTKEFKPAPGDLNICFRCGALGRYDENMNIKLLSPEEQFDLCMKEPEMWDKIVKVQKEIHRLRPLIKK